MKDVGLDLSAYADVKAQAQNIYARVLDGSMPCDEPWPAARIAPLQAVDVRHAPLAAIFGGAAEIPTHSTLWDSRSRTSRHSHFTFQPGLPYA